MSSCASERSRASVSFVSNKYILVITCRETYFSNDDDIE